MYSSPISDQRPRLNIVADANMPQVSEIFAPIGDVTLVDGRSLDRNDICSADILLVRSVTKVTPALLKGTAVKFVGSATAGLDHIHEGVISHPSIGFANAAGANARSVVEYDLAVLAYLHQTQRLDVLSSRFGVVAYGNVGRQLCLQLQAFGIDFRVYDPLAEVPAGVRAHSLTELHDVDVLCVHAPLTRVGPYPTKNMIDDAFLRRLKPDAVILSVGRGGVVDEAALKLRLCNSDLSYCADVWDGEPTVDRELLAKAKLATPHIAGYSIDSKIAATQMLFDAASEHLGIAIAKDTANNVSKEVLEVNESTPQAAMASAVLQAFPIIRDDQVLRAAAPEEFDQLRATYWQRREFTNFDVCIASSAGQYDAQKSLLEIAGFNVINQLP